MTDINTTQRPNQRRRVYLDLTHLGRHVTGIERIAIELFEKTEFADADVRPVRANGTLAMVFMQQIWLPLLAAFNPGAAFVFPGFPPAPWFVLCRHRVVWYVHDLFLMTRPGELSTKAKLYMTWPFRFAVQRLTFFFVNSQKTADELEPFARDDAVITLYRPKVENVFDVSAGVRATRPAVPKPLKLVSLGTVEPRKNYAYAVAIRDALEKNGLGDVELHIIGRAGWGDARAQVEHRDNVIVHGYLSSEDVRRVLQDSDIYLCTSFDEGLGLPLLEAQYAGLPVVAPDAKVFHEVLGESGHFIPLNDLPTAASIIGNVLKSSEWRRETTQRSLANPARWNALATGDATHAHSVFAHDLARTFPLTQAQQG